MHSSTNERQTVLARKVSVTDDDLAVELDDGRTIIVPTEWFPRLVVASSEEREEWRLIASGRGIHWPKLDEDISVANLLNGQPSTESPTSYKNWLQARQNATSRKQRRRP